MVLNFHSHHPSAPVLTLSPERYVGFVPEKGQKLTVGIHPWLSDEEHYESFENIASAFSDPNVVAIGEIGIDPLRGASIDRQQYLMNVQAKHAVNAGKPIVFHIVRRFDLLQALYRELRPSKPWAVHGFRGKPEVVSQLAALGIYMSLGRRFNADSARAIPENLLLVETDEEPDSAISEVVAAVAEARGDTPQHIAAICSRNAARFYGL